MATRDFTREGVSDLFAATVVNRGAVEMLWALVLTGTKSQLLAFEKLGGGAVSGTPHGTVWPAEGVTWR